jgi:hypothetical protein
MLENAASERSEGDAVFMTVWTQISAFSAFWGCKTLKFDIRIFGFDIRIFE